MSKQAKTIRTTIAETRKKIDQAIEENDAKRVEYDARSRQLERQNADLKDLSRVWAQLTQAVSGGDARIDVAAVPENDEFVCDEVKVRIPCQGTVNVPFSIVKELMFTHPEVKWVIGPFELTLKL